MTAHYHSDSYRQVESTALLPSRTAPQRDETPVLLSLAQAIAEQPQATLQLLAECAMRVTQAHSAGISMIDIEKGEPVFRWVATAGAFEPYLHNTMPREFSPCGDTVRQNRLVLMRDPAQHYSYIASVGVPITEVLLSPVRRYGEPVGTVWVALHDGVRHFSAEDARLLDSVTGFVNESADLLDRLSFGLTI